MRKPSAKLQLIFGTTELEISYPSPFMPGAYLVKLNEKYFSFKMVKNTNSIFISGNDTGLLDIDLILYIRWYLKRKLKSA